MKKSLFILLLISSELFAADKVESVSGGVNYQFDEKPESTEVSYSSSIEKLFKNPAITSGLASGSQAINRSIESLMEAVFYSLLDNELIYNVTDNTQFGVALKRDVFTTVGGSNVIVDRFSMGPRYSKELKRIHKIPISLGVDGAINVFNIYHRSDGQRVAEEQDVGFFRYALNNWFGILPLLTAILPPSFNPNELYDPAAQIEAPFIFPLKTELFKRMPIGGIRSYSVSGGVHLPFELGYILDQKAKKQLEKWDNLEVSLPYTIFVTGEHRINVLRRDENIAWVGLTKVKRLGHTLASKLGRSFYFFDKVMKVWKGVALPFLPIDASVTAANALKYDHLYEFDLTKGPARSAYVAAVNGDFTVAHQRAREEREKKRVTGVLFHFQRNEDAIETENETATNVMLVKSGREQQISNSEIEIQDTLGKYNLLSVKREVQDEQWDLLVGSQKLTVRDQVELNVKKVMTDPSDDSKYTYTFAADDPDPIRLTLSLEINDRYVDTIQYRQYLQRLRNFLLLPLSSVPVIPLRENNRLYDRRTTLPLTEPDQIHLRSHVVPTQLGRMGARATVSLNTKNLAQILSRSEDTWWQALAYGYGQDPKIWIKKSYRQSSWRHLKEIAGFFAYPTRMIDQRLIDLDFPREATARVAALQALKTATTPTDKLQALRELFSTDYPAELSRALLLLTDLTQVQRSVSFSTKAKGPANATIKDTFDSLNDKVYKSSAGEPPPERQHLTKEMLAAFYPDEVRELRARPVVINIEVKTREPIIATPQVLRSNVKPSKHIVLRLTTKNMNTSSKARIYIRFEQGGQIQVGKFVLAEDVIEVQPDLLADTKTKKKGEDEQQTYEFWLTGPLSSLSGPIFDRAVDFGGEFIANIGISNDGRVWSDERTLRFYFENGILSPP